MGEFLRNLPFWLYHYGSDKNYMKTVVADGIKKSLNLPTVEGKEPDNGFHNLMKKINNWVQNYHPGHYPGRIVYYKARGQGLFRPLARDKGWRRFAGQMDVCSIPGSHNQMLEEPHVRVLARKIDSELRRTPGH